MKTLEYKITNKEDSNSLNMAFTKTEADKRKKWILDSIKTVSYTHLTLPTILLV